MVSKSKFSGRILGKAIPEVDLIGINTVLRVYIIRNTAVCLNIISYQSFLFNLENYIVMKVLLFAVCKELSVTSLLFSNSKADYVKVILSIFVVKETKAQRDELFPKVT